MKTDSRIIISIDKQFYSEDDEIKIHVWFNSAFLPTGILTVLGPTGIKVASASLKTIVDTTETFAFACGGPLMFVNGYYTIRVECYNVISETMFEYYNARNRDGPWFAK